MQWLNMLIFHLAVPASHNVHWFVCWLLHFPSFMAWEDQWRMTQVFGPCTDVGAILCQASSAICFPI